MTSGKCPYCGGDGKKESGRVAATQSHLTFGYIERVYRCRKCAGTWSVCFPIPPKGSHKGMPLPNAKIIKAGFDDLDRKSTRLNSSHVTVSRMP